MVKIFCFIFLLYNLENSNLSYNLISSTLNFNTKIKKNKFKFKNLNRNYNIRFYTTISEAETEDENKEYIKLKIENPFDNRKQILNAAKNKKGVYIFEILNKNMYYIGSSINLYSRVCSYFMPSILAKADR